jgi:glycosyltransferase 2 family protein
MTSGVPSRSADPPPAPGAPGRWLRTALGYGFAAAGLAWVMHDVNPRGLWRIITSVNAPLLAPAVALDVLSYWSQGFRWQLLLRPVGRLSALRATQAVYAGLFTNEIVPLRAGELVRAFLASRWLSTGVARVIPSMAVERMFDGIWLALGLGFAAIFVRLPKNLLEAADILGVLVIASLGLFLFLVFRKPKRAAGAAAKPESGWKPLRRVLSLTGRIAEGTAEIGINRTFALSFASSSFILIFQILAFWTVMLAYGLRLSVWEGAAVMLIVHFGTAIPNAPSNVGSYQFFTVLGLGLFGVEKTAAAGFSVAVFLILTVPLWIIGIFAVSRSGMTFREIRSAARKIVIPSRG